MRACLMLALVVCTIPDRPDPNPNRPDTPEELILGDWIDPHNTKLMLRIMPNQTLFMLDGKPSPSDGLSGGYTIDWTKKPARILLDPQRRGMKWAGIVKLEGDTLTLGMQRTGREAPTDFGHNTMVFQYKRVKR
jgi:uncharacterized protein (TIGR03067 family)